MAIFKITYSEKYRRATLYNFGCNFHCRGCLYKLKKRKKPNKFLSIEEIKSALKSLPIERVHFIGGEPTINPQLSYLLQFCKEELNLYTALGHTNGSFIPTTNLDSANVGFKAFDENLYLDYTGYSGKKVFEQFRLGFEHGLEMKANVIFIPGYIDEYQIEKIAIFLSKLDSGILFHIEGYIPVPGIDFRRPTKEEMKKAVEIAQQYLTRVTFSHLTPEEIINPGLRDDRFMVRQIL
ncbi:MAG: radical SAM protein [Deltaproteobacteria bacterium]|nr:radical SAM protein [Deltaproteobacteria bacterium]